MTSRCLCCLQDGQVKCINCNVWFCFDHINKHTRTYHMRVTNWLYIRFKLFNRRIVFYDRRVIPVLGVNSTLKDGLHLPMLEFDDVNIRELLSEIKNLQDAFRLGECIVVSTGRADSYHCFFLSAVSWQKAIAVCAFSSLTDLKHLQFSLKRNHFTLRVSGKGSRQIELVDIVGSRYPNTARIEDLKSYVVYETAVRVWN